MSRTLLSKGEPVEETTEDEERKKGNTGGGENKGKKKFYPASKTQIPNTKKIRNKEKVGPSRTKGGHGRIKGGCQRENLQFDSKKESN